MRQQAVKQVHENNEMEGALDTLGEAIARLTSNSDRVETAIPELTIYRRDEPRLKKA